MTRVAVLRGGPSSEHEISIQSGDQVAQQMPAALTVVPVFINRDGAWDFGAGPLPSLGMALDQLAASADVVFPVLHGAFGEDGTLQGLLDALGIPYVGSGVAASALAMDKGRAKAVYRDAGIPTPWGIQLAPGDDAEAKYPRDRECVVKPSAAGSSVGVSFPKRRPEGVASVKGHLDAHRDVVIEEVVRGTEVTCGVLSDSNHLKALPVTEIAPGEGYEYFDFEAKYTPGATQEMTPARISDHHRDEIQRLAVLAHRALGCRDLSRTDFIITERGPMALETNTMPGFTSTSLLPQAAQVAGIEFPALLEHLVTQALSRPKRAHAPPGAPT